jgi:hypothetical protein
VTKRPTMAAGRSSEQTTGPGRQAPMVAPAADRSEQLPLARVEFVRRLLDLGRRHGEIPIYGSADWEALDNLDPRRFASTVRAAECWWLDGTDEVMRARLVDELATADLLARWRVRMAGHDIREAVDDWPGVYDVVQARRAYRQRWGVSC